MFQISKILTNSANQRLHHAVIINSEMISDEFKVVSFKSDIPGEPLSRGQELLIAVEDEYFRGHVLSCVGQMQQLCCALVYLNERRAANNQLAGLQPADTFRFTVEKEKLVYDATATHHFFFGDESAIGLFHAYKETALQNNHEYFGVLELNPANEHVLSKLRMLIESVPFSKTKPAQNAIQWMEDMHPNCWMAWQNATFYLAGSSALTGPFCEYLQSRNVSLKQILVS